MEPLKKDKRNVASFLPYREKDGGYEFYLQMRDGNTKIYPNVFSLFGGGIEAGETAEQGLAREMMEELSFVPNEYQYFSKFETARTKFDVFVQKVDDSFESQVQVHEGEYGKFLSYQTTQEFPKVSPIARIIIEGFLEYLLTH